MNNLGRLFFCFVIILSGQFFKIGVGAVGDGELLESSEGWSQNKSHG